MAVRDFQYELQCFASKLWNLRRAGKCAFLTVESRGPVLSLNLKLDLSVKNDHKQRLRRRSRRAEAAAGKIGPYGDLVHPPPFVDAAVQVTHPVHPRVDVDVQASHVGVDAASYWCSYCCTSHPPSLSS